MMINSDQMNHVTVRGVQTVISIHSVVPSGSNPGMYSHTQSVIKVLNVILWEARWTYRWSAARVGHSVSAVCHCFQQWCVEHSNTCKPGAWRLHSTDACEDWCILQKKSRQMLHLLCYQGPLGTVCFQQDSDQVFLWPGYHLHHGTAKHSYGALVSWKSRLTNSLALSNP